MTTVYDVARVAGVSTATVSRVMRVQPGPARDAAARAGRDRGARLRARRHGQGLSRRRKDIIGFVGLKRGTARSTSSGEPAVRRPDRARGRGGTAGHGVLAAADVRLQRPAVRAARPGPVRQGRRAPRGRGGHGRADLRRWPGGYPSRSSRDAATKPSSTWSSSTTSAALRRWCRTCPNSTGTGGCVRRRAAGRAGRRGTAGRLRGGRAARSGSRINQVIHGDFSEDSGTGPPGSCSAASRCRRPWCARTTRWPSACCASCSARASDPGGRGGDRVRRRARQPDDRPAADHGQPAVP